MATKKNKKSVEELTKGYEQLEKEGKTKPVTKKEFDKAVKKVVKPKK